MEQGFETVVMKLSAIEGSTRHSRTDIHEPVEGLVPSTLGVPDWRIAADYPDDETSPRDWAWEFLRRNHDYRDYYVNKIEPLEKAGKLWPDNTLSNLDLDEAGCDEDPALSLLRDVELQFGILFYSNPFASEQNSAPIFVLQTCNRMPIANERFRFTFDLRLPLAPQLAKAQADAETLRLRYRVDILQETKSRLRPDKYVDYLRVLDAIDCQAARQVAAKNIFKRAHDPLKAFDNHRLKAVELRDRGYLAIAAHDASSFISRRLI